MSHQDPGPLETPVGAMATIGADRACPACQGSASQPLGTKGGAPLQLCASCGTIYAGTRPPAEALDELYDHYYDRARFELHPVIAASLDRLARCVASFRSTNRWLDVGYGEGGLLTVVEQQGWCCHGTEVSPAALKYGHERGWVVGADGSDDMRFPTGGFDVVTMIELIEHVTAPDEFFRSAARWLRPGGLLYLTTPNANSLNRRILGVDWSVISPPEHLTIWSPRGLGRALLRAGFRIERVRTEGLNPSELRVRVHAPPPGTPPVSRNQAGLALNEAFSRSPVRRRLKAAINQGLSLLRVGDSLKVWAIRGAGLPES
jgi:SAM-dependent methyltransferase